MCDDLTENENEAYLKSGKGMSRRDMGRLGLGMGFMLMLPACTSANPADVIEEDVLIEMPDGMADAYFVHPASGRHPAVLVWPDILSLRPAFRMMGRRLAQSGYSVLVINQYYRNGKAPFVEVGQGFSDPDVREKILPLARSLSPDTVTTDAKAYSAWLDKQSSVDTSRKMGTTGYCMGGPQVFRTAATLPDRIGAVASFHGGGLVTEAETSPHLLIPEMKAGFLIAIAENDDAKEPDAKTVLKTSFAANGLSAEIEVYEGAMHGWCPPDSAVYNEAQAEKAWARLLHLLETELV